MLDLCLIDSYPMYKIKTGKSPQPAEFQFELIRQPIQKYGPAKRRREKGVPQPEMFQTD